MKIVLILRLISKSFRNFRKKRKFEIIVKKLRFSLPQLRGVFIIFILNFKRTSNTFLFIFQDERFEFARKQKLCINALRTAGERIGRYALAKKLAVFHEDFSTARLRKEQIEIYRKLVFEKLLVDQLIETSETKSENDVFSEVYAGKPVLPNPPSLQDIADMLNKRSNNKMACHFDPPSSNVTPTGPEETPSPVANKRSPSSSNGSPTIKSGSLRRRNKSAPNNNSYKEYESRPASSLRKYVFFLGISFKNI